jgi:hypothetical protein
MQVQSQPAIGALADRTVEPADPAPYCISEDQIWTRKGKKRNRKVTKRKRVKETVK